MDAHPVTRFDCGSAHGWYLGRTAQWGLLPGDEAAWSDEWLRYCEASGTRLVDLGFRSVEHRVEFVRDIGL